MRIIYIKKENTIKQMRNKERISLVERLLKNIESRLHFKNSEKTRNFEIY